MICYRMCNAFGTNRVFFLLLGFSSQTIAIGAIDVDLDLLGLQSLQQEDDEANAKIFALISFNRVCNFGNTVV